MPCVLTAWASFLRSFLSHIFCVVFFDWQDPSQFVSAKVENIVSYGAFFGLEDGCSGFVHISQVRLTDPTLVPRKHGMKAYSTVDVECACSHAFNGQT